MPTCQAGSKPVCQAWLSVLLLLLLAWRMAVIVNLWRLACATHQLFVRALRCWKRRGLDGAQPRIGAHARATELAGPKLTCRHGRQLRKCMLP